MGKRSKEFLVTVYFQKANLILLNTPVMFWTRGGFEFEDPHWIAVILLNGHKNKTMDYLEYINAKDGYASLYDLPRNNTIKFIA